MIKLLTLTVATLLLSGCYAYLPLKYTASKFCNSTDAQKEVIRESADNGLKPYKVRVECP